MQNTDKLTEDAGDAQLALGGGAVSPARHQNILVLNCGSSSLKFGLFEVSAASLKALISGEVSAIGQPDSSLLVKDGSGLETSVAAHVTDQKQAVARVFQVFEEHRLPSPTAVGHRVVHGGPNLRQHCLIDAKVSKMLEAAAPFAPLHTPQALRVVAAATKLFPHAAQAACFDTTFHASMPDVARVLPIPRSLEAEGVYRYGFHGLSCESIVHQFGAALPDRLVIAHLGNGVSVTAVRAGASIDTSMGLTPTGGVMMGTRSGDIDPGVLLYLMREKHFTAGRLEELVDRRSGLLGVSGISSDMRAVQAAAASNPDARLAVEMFAYQLRKKVATMIAVLSGVDGIVFTGGMGENDPSLRAAICDGLSCMGVDLDGARNQASTNPISEPSSRSSIFVLPSQEDEQIARHTYRLVCAPA